MNRDFRICDGPFWVPKTSKIQKTHFLRKKSNEKIFFGGYPQKSSIQTLDYMVMKLILAGGVTRATETFRTVPPPTLGILDFSFISYTRILDT